MTTTDRTTWVSDLKLNQSASFFNSDTTSKVAKPSLKVAAQKVAKLNDDARPLQFASPTYNPLTPERLAVVHTTNSPTTGGFQGMTRSGGTKPHGGIDIRADIGTGVLASEDGVVVRANYSQSYGNVIYVNHRGGYQTRYAHLSELNVKEGDSVTKGELIGSSGKSGNAQGKDILSHLHFEIRKINNNAPPLALDEKNKRHSKSLDPLPMITRLENFHFEFNEDFGNSRKIVP